MRNSIPEMPPQAKSLAARRKKPAEAVKQLNPGNLDVE
jgi:hypothetical protein